MSYGFPPAPDDVPLNPYEPPKVEIGYEGISLGEDVNTAETVRRAHIKHEASVKGLGALVIFGAFCFIVAGVAFLAMGSVGIFGNQNSDNPFQGTAGLIGGFVAAMMGVFFFFVGRGLRRLQPWARWSETVVCVLSLISYGLQFNPIGLLFSLYFLYLLLSAKGSMVFSQEYKEVIAKTPYIRYQTSLIVKIFLGIFIALIVIGVVSAFILGARGPN